MRREKYVRITGIALRSLLYVVIGAVVLAAWEGYTRYKFGESNLAGFPVCDVTGGSNLENVENQACCDCFGIKLTETVNVQPGAPKVVRCVGVVTRRFYVPVAKILKGSNLPDTRVAIRSIPSRAEIFVDGESTYHITPATLFLKKGRIYEIQLRKRDHDSWTWKGELRGELRLSGTLKPLK